jgi:hypothetical protein
MSRRRQRHPGVRAGDDRAGKGVIVNMSSGWGRSVAPDVAPYCASKWAIEGLTKALAQELPDGMAAVPLNPGVIDTDMLRTCFQDGASSYPKADAWARTAGPFILGLGPKDNGRSLSVGGFEAEPGGSEHRHVRLDLRAVVDPGEPEAEQLQEFAAVSGDVGRRGQVLGRDAGPDPGDGGLDLGAHLQVVDPDPADSSKVGRPARKSWPANRRCICSMQPSWVPASFITL